MPTFSAEPPCSCKRTLSTLSNFVSLIRFHRIERDRINVTVRAVPALTIRIRISLCLSSLYKGRLHPKGTQYVLLIRLLTEYCEYRQNRVCWLEPAETISSPHRNIISDIYLFRKLRLPDHR
jgi:hypothetical protein